MRLDLTRWPEADDILDAALALPEPDRRAYVRRMAADADLVRALDAVLDEAVANDGFLEPSGALAGSLGRELREAIADEPPVLAAGSLIEHYEVITPLGRGGMGEVYRAKDTRLARDVAIKVLPARYARDVDRRARFQREARVLASLNHPGIAAIYGVAETHDVEALVLELVEGPTLAELIAAGPRPLDEVMAIAMQLVDAIGAAHSRGILHRDLKPANIKVSSDGVVKILDFGLARALDRESAVEQGHDLTGHSAQMLIGTASYMSPEQARGRRVDERTDIWAFGCVLFEMLTGSRAFSGASVADVLAAVIEREPAFSLLPAETPAPLRRLLRRCLDKNPDRRLGYIGDARLDLEDAQAEPHALGDDDAVPSGSGVRRGVLVVGAVVVLLSVLAAGLWFRAGSISPPPTIARLTLTLPTGDRPVTAFQPMVAISPGSTTQLFRRDLEALEAVPLAGTEGASSPIFSPDGRSLVFDADGVLKRMPLSGGSPVVLSAAPGGVTGAWLTDNTIVFATNTSRVLQQIPASGGTPEPITTLDGGRGDTLHLLPREVPGRRSLLFTVVAGATRYVATLDRDTGTVQLLTEGSHATFVAPDVLVFAREGSLWGARFDPARMAIAGSPVPLEGRVAHTDNTVFHYAVAPGAMVYLPPQSSMSRQRLVWIDRRGRETPVNLEPRSYVRVSLSPDDERLALAVDEDGNQDIWMADPSRNTMTRLTFEPTIETMPAFTPDGRAVAFRSEREGPGVFRRDAQGSGTTERLTTTDGPIHSPYSWTPDGRTLLLAVFRSFRQQAIGQVTPPSTAVEVLLDGDFAQLDPHVSPDGRWLAYQSDETGRFEVYVRPYPDVHAGRWLISDAGGTSPRWARTGRELFFYDGDAIVRVPITAGSTFAVGRAERLFHVKPFGGRLGPDFEVASDDQRFLFLVPTTSDTPRQTMLVFVQHWVQELNARLASAR
jgi:eukaryotic-like serine/threonine-protein kinase